jgi:WD40 repeat protein
MADVSDSHSSRRSAEPSWRTGAVAGLLLILGGVAVWFQAAPRPRAVLPPELQVAALSADGRWLAAVGAGRVLLWDLGTGEAAGEMDVDAAGWLRTEFEFSPDARWLAGSDGRVVTVWEVPGGRAQFIGPVSDRPGFHPGLTFSPDGTFLAFRAEGPDRTGQVGVWDVPSARERLNVTTGRAESLVFSADGATLACAARNLRRGELDDSLLRLWDVRSGREWPTLEAEWGPWRTLALSPDGRLLATGEQTHQPGDLFEVFVWDLETRQQKGPWIVPAAVRELRFVRGGERLLVVTGWPKATSRPAVAFIDPAVRPVGETRVIRVDAYSPDGGVVAVRGKDGRVNLVELPTRVTRSRLPARPDEEAWAVLGFSPDAKWLAVRAVRQEEAGDVTDVRVYDTATGRAVADVPAGNGSDCRFTADGRAFVVTGRDQAPTVWDLPPAADWENILRWWAAILAGFAVVAAVWWRARRRRLVSSGRSVL